MNFFLHGMKYINRLIVNNIIRNFKQIPGDIIPDNQPLVVIGFEQLSCFIILAKALLRKHMHCLINNLAEKGPNTQNKNLVIPQAVSG
jgi:hypothetical protein